MEITAEILRQANFSAVDWGIVVLYLAVSVAIGLIANRYVANMADYVVAGRGLRTALGIATLTGTELGLVTVMYNAQKGFTGGFAAFHIGVIAGVTAFFVGLTGFILVPLRRHEVLTIPEFYGKRFGPAARVTGGIILAFGGILNMGMFLRAGSIFIVGVTGLESDWALKAVMIALLGLVLFYTVLGGMVSVVLTDYVQFVVLSFGLLLATAYAIWQIGWNNIFDVVKDHMGPAGFNPLVAESSFGPEYVIWMIFAAGIVGCALWPTSVARALACDSEATVRKQFMLSSFSYMIRTILPYFWGICALVFVLKTPDLAALFFPQDPGAVPADKLFAMPLFMGRFLPAGFLGLITAAMIAAFMSTHDSYLLCWSSVLTNDVAVPLAGGRLSDRAQVTLTRFFVILIGGLILTVSFVFPLREDLWDYMAVTGAIYTTGAFAVLLGGLYWRRASRVGAMAALITGSSAVFGLGGIQEFVFASVLGMAPGRVETLCAQLTGARVGLVTVGLSLAAMILGSLVFPDRSMSPEEAEA